MKTGKILCFLVWLYVFHPLMGNMASPLERGSEISSPFSSRDIQILREEIAINPDGEFQSAHFRIIYEIYSDSDRNEVPLLFYAMDYHTLSEIGFKVMLNGKPLQFEMVSAHLNKLKASEEFLHWKKNNKTISDGEVVIYWDKNAGQVYKITDLIYFEAPVKKGTHRIEITYDAKVWIDKFDWVKKYQLRYSLSPAKYWKSFGHLNIVLYKTHFKGKVTSNLGIPHHESTEKMMWEYNKLPEEVLLFSYAPKISFLAKSLIALGPIFIAFIVGLLFSAIQLIGHYFYRKKHPKKSSPWIWIGSIVVPFIFLLVYVLAFDWIDQAIGISASKRHGYPFLAFIFYFLIVPLYWMMMRTIDKYLMRK